MPIGLSENGLVSSRARRSRAILLIASVSVLAGRFSTSEIEEGAQEAFVAQRSRSTRSTFSGSRSGRWPYSSDRRPSFTSVQAGKKEWFGINDVRVVKRNPEDVAAFHEKERARWRQVYNEDYVETSQDFYPGDRVEIIDDESDYEGQQGVVVNFDFDDGYMSCQTTNSRYQLTVVLDERT